MLGLALLGCFMFPASAASAAGWSSVPTPRRSGLSAVSCRSPRWCEAVGGWDRRLTAARWNGSRWLQQAAPAHPLDAYASVLTGLECSSVRSCLAVGEYFTGSRSPAIPLIERWSGDRWSIQAAPSARAPHGYRYTNTRLEAVTCPSSRLCFAVGQAVAFGAGNAPGTPLIEGWNGRRWTLASSPQAAGPLTSISCASARSCTAVGGYENEVGNAAANNFHELYVAAVEHWDGHSWALQSFPTPVGAIAALPFGIS